MRLFAAVWPSPGVRAILLRLPRPELPRLRWTTPDQWHVTLAFFGDVPEEEHGALTAAIGQAAGSVAGPLEATLGSRTTLLGPGILCVTVDGLDTLAEAVRRQAAGWSKNGPEPFSGHVTLCRARGGARGGGRSRAGSVPPSLVGLPVRPPDARPRVREDPGTSWLVDEASLVSSSLEPGGSVYQTVARARLDLPRPG